MKPLTTRLAEARAKMLILCPFFATLLMSMPQEIVRGLGTAATDGRTIYIDPDWAETIDDDTLLFVLAHEIGHAANEHVLRLHGRDMMDWNIATDYSWNLTLKDVTTKDGRPVFKVMPTALCDEKYRDKETGFAMSADTIYHMIHAERQKQPQQPQSGQGQQGSPGQSQPSSGGHQPPPQGGQPQSGQPGPGDPHYSPMLGDLKKPEGAGNREEEDKLSREIQQRVAQAATVARMMGNLSAGLERLVDDIINPKVPWQDVLRHLMTEFAPEEDDWNRRNRRFSDVYLPTEYSERMGDVVCIDDTSGSISDDELIMFNSEQAGIIEETNPTSIRIVYCDSRVKGEQYFAEGEFDPKLLKPKGGGGTDMRVALKHVVQYDPRVVVLLTDGHTPWPASEPDFPLIVCCTTEVRVPIGQVVRL